MCRWIFRTLKTLNFFPVLWFYLLNYRQIPNQVKRKILSLVLGNGNTDGNKLIGSNSDLDTVSVDSNQQRQQGPLDPHPVHVKDMGKNCSKPTKNNGKKKKKNKWNKKSGKNNYGGQINPQGVSDDLDVHGPDPVNAHSVEKNSISGSANDEIRNTEESSDDVQNEGLKTSNGEEEQSPISNEIENASVAKEIPLVNPKISKNNKKSKANKKGIQTPKISFSDDKTGSGQGIEGIDNSCYLDSTLFSLFYSETIFDERLLEGKYAKDTRDQVSEEVSSHLKHIVKELRGRGYCAASHVTRLRESMVHINPRLRSTMMDVDELISNLFGKALHLQPFVEYYISPTIKTGNFLHQIMINPSKPREPVGYLQDLLLESMTMQRLKFAELPKPALIIKMPRSGGNLVGHEKIIPNFQLDISQFMAVKEPDNEDKNESKMDVDVDVDEPIIYELSAVITLRGYHYTSYVRCGGEWVYFNDLPPSIRKVSHLTERLQNHDGCYDMDFERMIRDIHVCIYKPNAIEVTTL